MHALVSAASCVINEYIILLFSPSVSVIASDLKIRYARKQELPLVLFLGEAVT